ncbi:hypothetical protein MHK_005879, partial [Candidatus Magnetomorum sp. HK-1]
KKIKPHRNGIMKIPQVHAVFCVYGGYFEKDSFY